jgi:hypothetical protein
MNRRDLLRSLAPALLARAASPAEGYQVGAYYFPGYHPDPLSDAAHGPGWTEWELVKRAEPRFSGHQQPKKPLWGYEDESDPRAFSKKIDAAADHGLNHFLFDWYWYHDGPFLNRGLDVGYMQAPNNRRLKFALMWANHDWVEIQPAKLNVKPGLLHPGAVDRKVFDHLTDHVIEKYFKHPSHWKIDGAPYFSVYELYRLVQGLGGVEPAKAALSRFREKTKAAGFPDLHLNAVTWGVQILPGEQRVQNTRELLATLGFNSTTSYVWIHHVRLPEFPVTAYADVAAKAAEHWRKPATEFGLPYHPNVTMGWDASPRTCQSDRFLNKGYPFMPTMGGNTPAAFREALQSAKRFLDSSPSQPRILTINAWNEWTEGSYLEPDTINGFEYLKAIREVFGKRA